MVRILQATSGGLVAHSRVDDVFSRHKRNVATFSATNKSHNSRHTHYSPWCTCGHCDSTEGVWTFFSCLSWKKSAVSIFSLYHNADSALAHLQWLIKKTTRRDPNGSIITSHASPSDARICNRLGLKEANTQMRLSELQASKQTRTDVLITTRQICYGKTCCAPLCSLRWSVFLALCLPSCTSALRQRCRGRSSVKTSLVTVLDYSLRCLYFESIGSTSKYQLGAEFMFACGESWNMLHRDIQGETLNEKMSLSFPLHRWWVLFDFRLITKPELSDCSKGKHTHTLHNNP